MRPFTHLGECYGKTIEAISPLGERAFITFTDGTYTSIVAIRGYDESDADIETNDDYEPYYERGVLSDLGIESIDVIEAAYKLKCEACDKRNEEHDRAIYERLKKRFG